MLENLFDLSLTKYQLPQKVVTDTVIPTPTVSVYFIHSFEQPFCEDATCKCHAQEREVERLFVKIVEGHFELEKAVDLIDDDGKENRA